jgi:serine/threonine protein kinase
MSSGSISERNPVERLAEEFAQRCRRGDHPSLEEYVARYPELADDIRELFPALLVMERLKPAASLTSTLPSPASPAEEGEPRRLGDYRILREVGRGGMGVVYEAVQESLGRHVALKVLPGHGLAEPGYLERFRREAKAAARLHHTNIVPVFGTGDCDGVHFYAMQFIPGQGLDRVLDDLRRLRQGQPAEGAGEAARSLCTGNFSQLPLADVAAGLQPADSEALESAGCKPAATSAESGTMLSANHSGLSGAGRGIYYQSVARIGVQVADALAHAHRQGILHRDIKPSNLLLDPQGTVWVTDFGLAKADDSAALTNTGDVVGTLRYMPPERFDGLSLPQGDLYSLGLTLYELLTLRPPFDDANRVRLIERVLCEPPPPPRRLDPRLPRDLETVVLKCLAKDPHERYSGAEDLADDLRRFLADQPVRARRSPWRERAWRWCRRNRAVASLSAVVIVLLVALAVGSAVAAAHFYRQREQVAHSLVQAQKAKEQVAHSLGRAQKAEEEAKEYQKKLELHLSVLPDPGNLEAYRGKTGKTFRFRVIGDASGNIWGSDIYSSDSWLATAAVHAGALQPGEQGVVEVTMLPGQPSYASITRNGVASGAWKAYIGSYRVTSLTREGPAAVRPAPAQPSRPGTSRPPASYPTGELLGYRGQVGKVVYLDVTGSKAEVGTIWGTDVYTDDSPLGAAAVHAGVLRPGQRGRVKITILPGRESYQGSVRNGVTSEPYGPWDGSYRIEAAQP